MVTTTHTTSRTARLLSLMLDFGQIVTWDGDLLIEIVAFWDSALLTQQVGLA